MKKIFFLLLVLASFSAFSQISLKVYDENGAPVPQADVKYNNQVFKTDDKGFVKIPLASSEQTITVEKETFSTFSKNIKTTPKVQTVNVYFVKNVKEKTIEAVNFHKISKPKITDLTSVELSPIQAKQVASLSGGIEGILKSLPSVNSNTELSSQYMVRGGNYDENLIYINNIEIYRPFLIRNSLQEGLSIINPDMVSLVSFSPGGFEAKYGDKMASALNIYYRQPEKFELSGEASLIGGRLTTGFATKDKDKNTKLTALFSGRYRNTNLVLNTLKEDTDFNPQYWDFQSYINYNFNSKWSVSFLGYFSQNKYEMIPKQKTVNFGSLQNPITVYIGYDGQEEDSYKNMMGTASVNYKPNKKWTFTLDNFAYQNREREYYSIFSQYFISTVDPVTGNASESYDLGLQLDHARNDLLVRTYGSQFKTRFSPDVNTDYEVGVKFEKENLQDNTNEWQYVEDKGYSVPRTEVDPGILDMSDLNLKYRIAGENNISPTRLSAYGQFSKKFYWGTNKIFINAGVRGQHWSFNDETIISPRFQFAIKPDWNETDMLFKLSGGIYYQAPFYKEIKDLSGNFNSDIKAQRSYQLILSNDYEFKMADRPFKLTTEVYGKLMDRLIPYYIDNVRTRYSGQNNATGYAYGIDTRLFGKFVPGVDSWISASYARAYQNIGDRGNIPLPTDQRFRFSMFFQDYMPKFHSMRVNLTLVYANGLPSGTPVTINPTTNVPDFTAQYTYQKTLPSYKRVDIGLTKIFIDQDENQPSGNFWRNFKELSLGVQIFNAFNIRNVIGNQWITDVSSEQRYVYPVPSYLTGRFFNVKLEFKL